MSDDENDEDLKRAIALSLQEGSPPPLDSHQAVINLISDDEDDDLDAPLTTKPALSQAKALEIRHSGEATRRNANTGRSASDDGSASGPAPKPNVQQVCPQTSGLLGLDRKRMEEERLARASALRGAGRDESIPENDPRKRKVVVLSQEHLNNRNVKAKVSKSSNGTVAEAIADVIVRRESSSSSANGHGNSPGSSSKGIQYPDGIVKKTWANGYPRDGSDIKIEEVLQKDDLVLAVLSAFQIEPDWIISKLDEKTKVVWILQAKSEAENWRDAAPKKYRFCFPSICFLIDLPKLPSGETAELTTQFGIELSHFLNALGLDQKIVDSLRKFDFSRTGNIAFIHSIGGSHDIAWHRTGYCGLGLAVQKLGAATDKALLDIDFLAASIGSLNEDFIRAMCLACQGDDGLTEYRERTGKSTRGKGSAETGRKPVDGCLSRCQIYFPTEQTVARSKGGTASGGTICLQEKSYNSEHFPRLLMRDCL
ncbi:hypothetical protein EG329_010778 [Mollisiaceae sp. DMI_Dod_QoI]|nr:hypothetical protein EG329_010778 [Helotiales sp. DMI_Dod_QoI]